MSEQATMADAAGDDVDERRGPPYGVQGVEWCVAAVVAVGVGLLFGRATANGFVELDDLRYVVQNREIHAGLTWETWRWAWRPTSVVLGNWHPLTMLSHALDCQWYGLDPRGHHLTSVLWHAANTALVFLLLVRLTGGRWASLLAALLFGIHPLRVESVAWVAERKDVLSSFFGILALHAYAGLRDRPGVLRLAAVTGLMLLSLLSKPMWVTLPWLLLLMDYWPLGRWGRDGIAGGWSGAQRGGWRAACRRAVPLVVEKLPLWLLAAGFSLLTLWTQQAGVHGEYFPLLARVLAAVVAYADYAGQVFWPARLAVYYPLSERAIEGFLIAGAGLALVSWLAWRQHAARPWLWVGWLWFVVALVPVIGLVKAGSQARADRYTYLPSVGLAVAVAWEWWWWSGSRREHRGLGIVVAVVCVAVLGGLTWRQIGVWRDSRTLFTHALTITGDNVLAEIGLAHALVTDGEADSALAHLDRALELQPGSGRVLASRGFVLAQVGRYDEAREAFEGMLAAGWRGVAERHAYAAMLLESGDDVAAGEQYRAILALDPQDATAHAARHVLRARRMADPYESAEAYQAALAEQSDFGPALAGLAWLWGTASGALPVAAERIVSLAERACRPPEDCDPRRWDVLAAARGAAGDFAGAVAACDRGLAIAQAQGARSPQRAELAAAMEARRRGYARGERYRAE